MGKREKKPNRRRQRGAFSNEGEDFYDQHPSAVVSVDEDDDDDGEEDEAGNCEGNDESQSSDLPSKFLLYQQSVQSPKGDISYLQKFFLMYVSGRLPLHFQEDFCGTALLSVEWLKSDTRRTAIGLDLDLEALEWCIDNNISKLGADGYSRMSLFHGNVLSPLEAKPVKSKSHELIQNISLDDGDNEDLADPEQDSLEKAGPEELPKRDIVCAFNYSCCCLHKRSDLVSYFKNALNTLTKRGGIFVMDLYGGASAEGQLKLQRKFPNFTYIWEQAEFDIVGRMTKISLHYNLQKQNKKIRHAFSYSWRLWSLPEIKDCMEEAGFKSVHFWLREMPDASEMRHTDGFGAGRDIKYEEVKNFQQCDAWNAYIVAVNV